MKRALTFAMFVLIALALTVPALAHGGQPPAPVCGPDQETIAPAEWVPGDCTCPAGYSQSLLFPGKCVKWFGWVPHYVNKVCTPGYWTAPVCEPIPVSGCTDPLALNYNPEATLDDGSCEYAPPPDVCEDEEALNYGEEGECRYPEQPEIPPTPACAVTRAYVVWRYSDPGAPSWYFLGGACWVMTRDDTYQPATELAAAMCSCNGVDPDFRYVPGEPISSAWVYVDCTGRVWSDDPDWNPEWFRPSYASGGTGGCCPVPAE